MADNETITDIIAEMRDEAAKADMEQDYSVDDAAEMMREFAWRIESAHKRERAKIEADALEVGGMVEAERKRERVLAVSIMRAKLYGIAGGLRAITARSDARQRGIHYTEVQNIAAQIENIADNGGEA